MTKEAGVKFRGSEILNALEAAFLLVELSKPENLVRDLFDLRPSAEPVSPLETMLVAVMQDVLREKIGSGKVKRVFPRGMLKPIKPENEYLLPDEEIMKGSATSALLKAIGDHERDMISFSKRGGPIEKVRASYRDTDIGVMLDSILVEYVGWMGLIGRQIL